MKNLTIVTEEKEFDDLLERIFLTEEFRNEVKNPDSYLAYVFNKLKKRPVIFYEPSGDIERHHFLAWMGCVQWREYENNTIHDLHMLHEILHVATMQYQYENNFCKWHKKMCDNEYEVATASEAYIYMVMPEIREKSFPFEIWVDRFFDYRIEESIKKYTPPSRDHGVLAYLIENLIHDSTGKEGRRTNSSWRLFQTLVEMRKSAMVNPDPWDFIEMQIHTFARQNVEFSIAWKDNWLKVERHMAEMLRRFKEASHEEARKRVLKDHISWLQDIGHARHYLSRHDFTPFHKEALAFARADQDIYRRGGNHFLEKGKKDNK